MTQEEIMRMAEQAGMFTHKEVQPEIQAFAKLVAAKEREACAKLIEDIEAQCVLDDVDSPSFDELEKSLQRKVAHGVTDGSKVTIDRAKLMLVLEALYFLPALSPAQNELQDAAIEAIEEALEDV